MNGSLLEKIAFDGIDSARLSEIQLPTFAALNKLAMEHSDAVVAGSEVLTEETQAAFSSLDIPTMSYMDADMSAAEMATFYDSILEGKGMAVEE